MEYNYKLTVFRTGIVIYKGDNYVDTHPTAQTNRINKIAEIGAMQNIFLDKKTLLSLYRANLITKY